MLVWKKMCIQVWNRHNLTKFERDFRYYNINLSYRLSINNIYIFFLFCNTNEFRTLLLTYINKNKNKWIATPLVTWKHDYTSTDITYWGSSEARHLEIVVVFQIRFINCGLPWWHLHLTLILLTWNIGWAFNNANKWQMGFNSAFKGLTCIGLDSSRASKPLKTQIIRCSV
jgi:hypothetical protein